MEIDRKKDEFLYLLSYLLTTRYITSEEKIDIEESRPPGRWSESSKELEYVEEKCVKKSSRLSFRKEVGCFFAFSYCRFQQ